MVLSCIATMILSLCHSLVRLLILFSIVQQALFSLNNFIGKIKATQYNICFFIKLSLKLYADSKMSKRKQPGRGKYHLNGCSSLPGDRLLFYDSPDTCFITLLYLQDIHTGSHFAEIHGMPVGAGNAVRFNT